MSWNSFEESLEFLHNTLENSLNKLLIEAKYRNCILPPYGRPPTPSPFVNESEIDIEELLNNPLEIETNDRENFNYDYGFNPLIFLSQLILKSHPLSIQQRINERNLSQQRLVSRVQHAKKQLLTSQELTNRVKYLQTGVIHGPLTSPLTSNSILFWCRTAISGHLILQLSKSPSFTPVSRIITIYSNGINEPIKYILDDLESSTQYYFRCYLQELQPDEDGNNQNEDLKGDGNKPTLTTRLSQHQPSQSDHDENDDSTIHPPQADSHIYAKGQFWTLVSVTESNQTNDTSSSHQRHSSSYPLEILILSRYPHYQPVEPPLSPPPLTTLWDTHPDEDLLNPSPAYSPYESYGYGLLSKISPHPLFTCYVGDILTPSDEISPSQLSHPLWSIFNRDLLLSSTTGQYSDNHSSLSPLRLGSLFLAWNDTSLASDTSLKAEEVIYKQWNYETRKFEKKSKERSEKEKNESNKPSKRPLGPPPVLTRPPMTPSFNTIIKDLPVMYTEDNIRHLYRSFWISKEIEVYVLDSRNGYLGKEQARWLKDSLRKTTAQYKLIFTGKSFGLQFINHYEEFLTLEREETKGEGGALDETPQDTAVEVEEENEENEENIPTTTDDNNNSESKEKTTSQPQQSQPQPTSNNSKKSTMSSSRQKALEATKEEFDEDGIGKTSLQHVIIHNYRKEYPEGYPVVENEGGGGGAGGGGDGGGGGGGDDNSSYNSRQILFSSSRTRLDSSREANDEERRREEENMDRLTEEQSETISQCFNSFNLHLLGGIILFSSTQASDSYMATYSFNQMEPQVPLSLQSSVHLACYCLEIGIGLGYAQDQEIKCLSSPHKNSAVEKIIQQGHHLLFRSLGPLPPSSPPLSPSPPSDQPSSPVSIPLLPLGIEGTGEGKDKEKEKERVGKEESQEEGENGHNEDNIIPTIQEHVDSPITSSLLLHSDGSLSIKLKCVGTGRTIYQANILNEA